MNKIEVDVLVPLRVIVFCDNSGAQLKLAIEKKLSEYEYTIRSTRIIK